MLLLGNNGVRGSRGWIKHPPPPKSKLLIFFLILLIVHFLKLLPSPLPPLTKVHSLWRPVESAPPDYRNIFMRIIHIYRKENSVSHQGYIEPVTAGCQGINVHFLFRTFFFFQDVLFSFWCEKYCVKCFIFCGSCGARYNVQMQHLALLLVRLPAVSLLKSLWLRDGKVKTF